MTKSSERGENDITRAVKMLAVRLGSDVCTILAQLLNDARKDGDPERIRKIIKAQKYLGCRNRRKRRKKS